MTTIEVTVARVYLCERKSHLDTLLQRLQHEKMRGVTLLRGIAGFGRSGKLHTASLLDLSLDLPLIVEFYDTPEKVEKVLHDLKAEFSQGHVLTWNARITGE